MYGTDMYIKQYEQELGPPWKSQDLWIKISYPFFHADRITTPTLFMGGEKDFNVPLLGGEQMYQALRSLGVDTQLVIYPGQFHGITTPSYKKDRLERYLDWYDRYLEAGAAPRRRARQSGVADAAALRFVDVRADRRPRDRDRVVRHPLVVERRARCGCPVRRVGGAISFDGAEVLVGGRGAGAVLGCVLVAVIASVASVSPRRPRPSCRVNVRQ